MTRSPRAGHLEPMGRSSLQPPSHGGAINALVMCSTPSAIARKHNISGNRKQNLSPAQRRWKSFRNVCRSIFEFMFTQVGVGGMVVGYTIVGAFIFQAIELSHGQIEHNTLDLSGSINPTTSKLHKIASMSEEVVRLRLSTLDEVWKLTEIHNIFNRTLWTIDVAEALFHHQEDMVSLIRQGYEEQTLEEKWSFPAALMFTLRYVFSDVKAFSNRLQCLYARVKNGMQD